MEQIFYPTNNTKALKKTLKLSDTHTNKLKLFDNNNNNNNDCLTAFDPGQPG